jgi:methylenetetrahydrofolate reductase (NADPH)
MGRLHPMFVDITWGAGGSTADLSLEIAANVQNLTGLQVMLHLTCTNLSRERLREVLHETRELGIQNILALRGDPPRGADRWTTPPGGLARAVDLVRFIREEHGDYFGICVAGYPGGHPEATSCEQDLQHLRAKVDAGADFVITQLFYDCDLYLRFVDDCRTMGIDCPILPGIMPIHNYQSFVRVTRLAGDVPSRLLDALEPIRNDDAAVREYGIDLVVKMCRRLEEHGVPGLHFYTLNLELAVAAILAEVGLVPERVERPLPWRRSANVKRRPHEDVRPIFWSNRPRSYLARTLSWDEFPNGRWGDMRSPAFGELVDHHLTQMHLGLAERRRLWGESLHDLEDVVSVFVRFCRGEIAAIPWYDSPLSTESEGIRERLVDLNRNGFLTINSQPRVDGAPSDHPDFGWGGQGGIVCQKAYLELFVDGRRLPALLDVFGRHDSLTFHAVNKNGNAFTNCDRVNAVTWGVFPGAEIIQPTVVDPASFMVWKDEAFALWLSLWGACYPEGSESRRLIQEIHDTFFLVNVVDNDFVSGNLWAVFDEVVRESPGEGDADRAAIVG